MDVAESTVSVTPSGRPGPGDRAGRPGTPGAAQVLPPV